MRRLWMTVLLAAGVLAPAAGAFGQAGTGPGGLGIRLVEAPANRAGDPRAQKYIVDHVTPGTTIRRKAEIRNDTDGPTRVRLYAGGAEIRKDAFVPTGEQRVSELARWASVSPATADLPRGAARQIDLTIAVPSDASAGERYGVIWAELPPVPTRTGITQINRVGIRVYLSVGPGGEPASDFQIDSLTARRRQDGVPTVNARVRNTGGRALDMSGELELSDGPGGVKAGPFPAKLGTTLATDSTASVEVALDKNLPNGPWDARITLRSGELERAAEGRITFPVTPGTSSEPVSASRSAGVGNGTDGLGAAGVVLAVFGLLALLAILFLVWFFWSRRRRED